MFPWLWLWSPQWNFPLSGGVAQKIEPTTNWFFDSIEPKAGNGRLEARAFEVASYGRQLGLIIELLLDMASRNGELSNQAEDSRQRLEVIRARIDKIKEDDLEAVIDEFVERLSNLKKTSSKRCETLKPKLLGLLGKSA